MNPFASLINQTVPSAGKRRPHCKDAAALERGVIELRLQGMAQNEIAINMRCTGAVVSEILKRHGMNSFEWQQRQAFVSREMVQAGWRYRMQPGDSWTLTDSRPDGGEVQPVYVLK